MLQFLDLETVLICLLSSNRSLYFPLKKKKSASIFNFKCYVLFQSCPLGHLSRLKNHRFPNLVTRNSATVIIIELLELK